MILESGLKVDEHLQHPFMYFILQKLLENLCNIVKLRLPLRNSDACADNTL